MATTLKRQLNESEKEIVLRRFGRKCFATGHEISENESVHFDHIKAFSADGASDIGNIAPMCAEHNLQKGTLPLGDFRIKLRLAAFFQRGRALTLRHELEYLKEEGIISSFGESVYHKISEGNEIELEYCNKKETYRLYTCPVTKWKYFYAILPVNVLNSDDGAEGKTGLQPRDLIQEKVFELYRHLQYNTVLHPSIARLCQHKILIFDGQHKIASLLWSERKDFELKIYIEPDPDKLGNTVIFAHERFAQTKFYSQIMVDNLARIFDRQFEEYKNREDGEPKTESGFIAFLTQTKQMSKGDVNKRFLSYLVHSTLDESKNKIVRLVSRGNRSTKETPLTLDMLNKSLFANFLYREPTGDDLTDVKQLRHKEIENLIRLCNILDEEILHHWDAKKTNQDSVQNQLSRMFQSKSIMAWSDLLKDAILIKLDIVDRDEQARIFYRELSDKDFEKIRLAVQRLIDWNVWKSPNESPIDRMLANNKERVKTFFRDNGLTVSFLAGGRE